MNEIPTAEDWQTDPAGALAAAKALADKTNADQDSTPATIALGIAAQVLATAAPIAGAALGGPLGAAGGALAGAALQTLATSLAAQHENALASLTPQQQALISAGVQVAAGVAQAKLVKP